MRPAYSGPIAPAEPRRGVGPQGGLLRLLAARRNRLGACAAPLWAPVHPPWPAFDGWDEFLPPSVGAADLDLGAYVAADVAAAVSYLRVRAVHEKIAGICAEAAAILPKAGAELG